MIKVSKGLQKLIENFFVDHEIEFKRQDPDAVRIKLNNAFGNVPVMYEKLRGSLQQNREEAFIFRTAVGRILHRRLTLKSKPMDLAEGLLKELIWAQYLPNDTILKEEVRNVALVIKKYQFLMQVSKDEGNGDMDNLRWLFDVAAVEIESQLFPKTRVRDLAMLEYVCEAITQRVTIEDPAFTDLSQEEVYLQFQIQIMQILHQSDQGAIHLLLLEQFFPGFDTRRKKVLTEVGGNLAEIKSIFDRQIKHPFGEKIISTVKRQASVFRVIQDILESCASSSEAQMKFCESEMILKSEVTKAIAKRTLKAKENLKRSTGRAMFFFFFSRLMGLIVFSIILRTDFTRQQIFNEALSIGFPPLILFFVSWGIKFPDSKNMNILFENLKEVIDDEVDKRKIVIRKPYDSRLVLSFQVFIWFTTLVTFGILVYLLIRLKYSWIGAMTFITFVSLSSFVGVRISKNTRELMVVERSGGFIGLVFDLFSFPIVRTGKFISGEFDRWNFAVFVMDYIIEAPFKNILNLAEEWASFMREKKDELY
jgi:hypothetical protein